MIKHIVFNAHMLSGAVFPDFFRCLGTRVCFISDRSSRAETC